jgi:hypothetical protein
MSANTRRAQRRRTRAAAGTILLATIFASLSVAHAGQSNAKVYTGDDSDWWSGLRSSVSVASFEPEKRELANSNFQILGINLDDKVLEQAAAKLGKTIMIQRGDASTGRLQACYVSTGSPDKVHLIFERGEVDDSFYLFSDGPDWDGSKNCLPSSSVSRNLMTASGLHLGQSPSEVIAILGKSTQRRPNELIYSFSVQKKTPARDLQRIRRQQPELSEKELRDDYGTYDLGVGVDAKFAHSRLIFLAVSKSETT